MRLEVWFDKISKMAKLLCDGELGVSQLLSATVGALRSERALGVSVSWENTEFIKKQRSLTLCCVFTWCVEAHGCISPNDSFNTLALLFIVD